MPHASRENYKPTVSWKSRRFTTLTLIGLSTLLLSACAIDPLKSSQKHAATTLASGNTTADTPLQPFKPIVTKEGQPLYGVLVKKDITTLVKNGRISEYTPAQLGQYFKKLEANDLPKSHGKTPKQFPGYELITVYETGAYPPYPPESASQQQDSMFVDDTFSDLMQNNNLQGKVVYTSDFDENKFLTIAEAAIAWVEESTPFTVTIDSSEAVTEEYTPITLHITHKPTLKIKKTVFIVNESAMYADLTQNTPTSRISHDRVFRLGLPFGQSKLKVAVTAENGEVQEVEAVVNNTFKAKPTLHLVAVGINEYPYLPADAQLDNAVKDAELVKNIFKDRGKRIFNKDMLIQPYSLTHEQTTKANIEKLISNIRQKVKPNDYFVMYVASHGILSQNQYYFTPSDFSFSINSSLLDDQNVVNGFGEDQISEYLMNIPTIFRMVILDTCHAGQEVNHIKEQLASVTLGEKQGISVLTAAKNTQLALDNYKGHGLFTYILGEGLKGGADYNKDNIVDSIEIAEYVRRNVGAISRSEMQFPQDAVVLPNPQRHHNRRFELTQIETKPFQGFQPNVFTPRESELYLKAIQAQNANLMNGIIKNNIRHNTSDSHLLPPEDLSQDALIKKLTQHKNVDINILFQTNSEHPHASEIEKLKIVAAALKSPALENKGILIEGHTDGTGDAQYNAALSQRRANQVTALLDKQFAVNPNRLTALGLGEAYPVGDDATPQGRAKNRRVSIFIYDK